MTGERSAPYHCPYCAGEDLHPHDATPGTWECRDCTRVFAVRLIGQIAAGQIAAGQIGTGEGVVVSG